MSRAIREAQGTSFPFCRPWMTGKPLSLPLSPDVGRQTRWAILGTDPSRFRVWLSLPYHLGLTMSPEEKELLWSWILDSFPNLKSSGWGSWKGPRPPVFVVHVWNGTGSSNTYAMECRHGYRGEVFGHWQSLDDKQRLGIVPECPKCLKTSRRWEAARKARELSDRRVAKVGKVFSWRPRGRWLRVILGGAGSVLVYLLGRLIYDNYLRGFLGS